jgi:hypothetical protein
MVDGAKGTDMSIKQPAAMAACAVIALSRLAAADIVSIQSLDDQSTDSLGSFSGSLSYVPSGLTGTLTVSLTNTTDPASMGGYITGFAFNFHSSDPNALLQLTNATSPFSEMTDVSCPPFGVFDSGAALGGSWRGGGSPLHGIAVGQTGTFTFNVNASDAATLGAADFISDAPNRSAFAFVVRFRGFANGGSDKVPGSQVPAPGAIALMGVAGLLAFRRKR